MGWDGIEMNDLNAALVTTGRCGTRLPADSLSDDVDVAVVTTSAADVGTVPANGTVPSATLGTVPSNGTVVSDDTVPCGDEASLDISSQSVEIITNEESNLLDLDLQPTSPPSDVTSHDLDPDTEGQFITACFYIGDESPTIESAANAGKVR